MLEKFNKVTDIFNLKGKTDGFKFEKLSEFADGTKFTLQGFYINTKAQFGTHPVAITSNCLISLPQHTLEPVNAIMNDPDAVEYIKSGKAIMIVESYTNDRGTFKSVKFK